MALLKHLKNEKSAQVETSAMRYPASQADPTTPIPFSLNRPIIRPALLLILLLFSSFSSLAYDCTIGGIAYDLNTTDKTASVTYTTNNKYVGNIIIPESITYSGATYSVTSIGDYAFSSCSGLTSVTIPNSVTSIGYRAFYGCSGLTSVTIPNSVTSIGVRAFEGCSGLTSVTIGNSVTSIGSSAFSGCSGLTSVTIGNSVTSIGYGAFQSCSGLTSVTIPNSVTTIGDSAFSGCSGLTSVTIPNSVTSIGGGAFFGCSGLTSVTIGNSVTSIGIAAFRGCSGLTSVIIPNSVTSIGERAFCDCAGLTFVSIPNSVTSIGKYAFADCSGLTSVVVDKNNGTYDSRDNCNAIIETSTNKLVVGCKNSIIPNSVTSIGSYAFRGCSGLTSVTIGNSVTSIGDGTFYGCSGLSSVTIGNSVTSIGEIAFSRCSGLTSVVVDKNNGTYDSRDNCNAIIETSTNKLVVGCKNSIIPNSVTSIGGYAFYNCSELTSVTIPNSVTSIGKYAFYFCSGLTSVTIGNSVTSIGGWAFYNCSRLTKLVSLAVEPPTCGEGVFEKVDKTTCQLLVPQESINKYKTADQWKEFLNILGYNGVDDVSVDSPDALYEVYNLQGVRVGGGMREAEVTADTLPHGVYILVSPQSRKKLKI